jgi:hypothetical protein
MTAHLYLEVNSTEKCRPEVKFGRNDPNTGVSEFESDVEKEV